jgi:predicted DNA-binding transcriptional regulator YafY
VPVPERRIDPFVLRAVLGAIRKTLALDVLYQSMSRPEPKRRLIEPHALAYDSFRWHARAFDRETGAFRDFVLGRMSKPKLGTAARARAADDCQGHRPERIEVAVYSLHLFGDSARRAPRRQDGTVPVRDT